MKPTQSPLLNENLILWLIDIAIRILEAYRKDSHLNEMIDQKYKRSDYIFYKIFSI